MNYNEKIKDPRWQKRRLEILKRDDWQCQICHEKERPLHVHHKMYLKETEPWDYENKFLITLCEDCHQYNTDNFFKYLKLLTESIKLNIVSPDDLLIYADALNINHNQLLAYSTEMLIEKAREKIKIGNAHRLSTQSESVD